MESLPEGLKHFLAHAGGAADAPRQDDKHAEGDKGGTGGKGGDAAGATGVHPGVSCDKSGMSPIVGMRYHLVGHNYDLCQAEFDKLDAKEQALFQRVPPPFVHQMGGDGAPGGTKAGVHPGVMCDRSGMRPIVGTRYHLRGANYDLCEAEYNKLPAHEKLLYVAIPPPCATGGGGMPWRGGMPWGPWRGGGCGRWGGHHGVGGGGGPCGGLGGHPASKLAARFVRDVTIFDGTQMAPRTAFTKIWRLKNTGEVAWPPGTKMLFVGGDQMTT